MAHAQQPDFVFLRNGRVHLNRQGRQFSRLLAAKVCASGVVMFRGRVKGFGYPLHSPVSPSLPLPCVTMCHHVSTRIYLKYVEIKCQLDATEVFIADLIACSACFGHHYAHHQGYVSGLQDAAASCKPDT